MANTFMTKLSSKTSWTTAWFVIVTFVMLAAMAALRLHAHYDGESFLHLHGLVDTLLVLFAPLAAVARFMQTHTARQGMSRG